MKALNWFKSKEPVKFQEAPAVDETPIEFEEPKNPYKGIKGEKFRHPRYRLPNGAAWNPLLKYPRNKGCFCGSGHKAKKCCLPYVSRCLQQKFADEINDKWYQILTGEFTFPRAEI